MKRSAAVQWTIRLTMLLWTLAAALPANAQSCPMCYNAAVATKASAIQALRSGTLILIFPVIFLFVGILALLFRSRNRFVGEEMETGSRHGAPVTAGSPEVPGDWNNWARELGMDGSAEIRDVASAGSKPAGNAAP